MITTRHIHVEVELIRWMIIVEVQLSCEQFAEVQVQAEEQVVGLYGLVTVPLPRLRFLAIVQEAGAPIGRPSGW